MRLFLLPGSRNLTSDLCRVNLEVNNLRIFASFAFPLPLLRENALERPSFGDELVTSFSPLPNTETVEKGTNRVIEFARLRRTIIQTVYVIVWR